MAELVAEPGISLGFLDRGQFLSLDILDEGDGEGIIVIKIANDCRNLVEAGALRGPPATLTGNQIIGQGQSQEIGVGVLSPTPTAGNTLGVNVLTGGQVVDVAIGGQSLTSGLTGTVTGILTGQGPTTTIGGVLTGEGGVIIGGGG